MESVNRRIPKAQTPKTQTKELMPNPLQAGSNRLLFLLLITDFIFVVMHVVLIRLGFDWFLFSLGADLGLSEIFQYVKEFWIFILLIVVAIGQRKCIYGSWACLFLYLLLDDSLQIHEKLGESLAEHLGLEPFLGLRPQDFGELVVSMSFGGVLLSFVLAAHLFSDPGSKRISRHIFLLVLCIAFFGVVVDMLHIMLPFVPGLTVLEDGGEMVVMSLILWYVFDLEWTRSPSAVTMVETNRLPDA